jgi:hypothetical protein
MHISTTAVFPIVSYENMNNVFSGNGTGFFINSNGGFVSAGHNFKQSNRNYFAVIDGVEIPLGAFRHLEYVDLENQVESTYFDLAIGEISNCHSHKYLCFSSALDLNPGEPLVVSGFVKGMDRSYISIEDLNEMEVQLFDPKATALRQLEKRLLNAKFVRKGFSHIATLINLRGEFTNGVSIQLDQPSEPHGISGGPVIFKGIVFGVYIAVSAAISSEHVISILQRENVSYFTS